MPRNPSGARCQRVRNDRIEHAVLRRDDSNSSADRSKGGSAVVTGTDYRSEYREGSARRRARIDSRLRSGEFVERDLHPDWRFGCGRRRRIRDSRARGGCGSAWMFAECGITPRSVAALLMSITIEQIREAIRRTRKASERVQHRDIDAIIHSLVQTAKN